MGYELRPLKATDLFAVAGILGKVGVKEFHGAFKDIEDGEAQGQVWAAAFNIVGIILENINQCEDELFKFLASVAGVTPKELRDAPPADLFDVLVGVVQSPDFEDFFTRVKSLLK